MPQINRNGLKLSGLAIKDKKMLSNYSTLDKVRHFFWIFKHCAILPQECNYKLQKIRRRMWFCVPSMPLNGSCYAIAMSADVVLYCIKVNVILTKCCSQKANQMMYSLVTLHWWSWQPKVAKAFPHAHFLSYRSKSIRKCQEST